MDINDAVKRQRQSAAREEQALRESREADVRKCAQFDMYARKFAQWAIQSGIEPEIIQSKLVKRAFGKPKEIPVLMGWILSPESRLNAWGNSDDFSISTTGEIVHNATYVHSLDVFQNKIANFIVKSGSRAPWPD